MKYKTIVIDPPWTYQIGNQHGKKAQEKVLSTYYNSLSLEELKKLPISDISEKNSVLFLWTTSPLLFVSKELIDAYGFNYKASFIWDKIKHNVGHYNSVRHEFLLISTKRSCLPDRKKLYDSVVSIERTEHSKKPEEFQDIIESIYDGPYLELFARRQRPDWTCLGNEIDGLDIKESLDKLIKV